MVLALHINITHQIEYSWILACNYAYACVAIPLFFMVSGFLMHGRLLSVNYSIKKIKGILKFVFITTTIIITYFLINNCIRHHNSSLYYYVSAYYLWIFQGGPMWQYWYFASMIIIYSFAPIFEKIFHSKYLSIWLLFFIIISLVVFILNSIFDFERKYVIQSFRIWYWFMYFLLGGYIRKHQDRFKFINWWYAIVMCLIYTIFQKSGIINVRGNEYYFGSIMCMIYAISVFCACINTKIEKSKTIKTLSSLFLPVYTVHPTILIWFSHFSFIKTLHPINQYFLAYFIVCLITILLSYLIMKIPIIKNIFRI